MLTIGAAPWEPIQLNFSRPRQLQLGKELSFYNHPNHLLKQEPKKVQERINR